MLYTIQRYEIRTEECRCMSFDDTLIGGEKGWTTNRGSSLELELMNTFQLIARSLRGGKKGGRQGRVGARPRREEAWQKARCN